jgi:hypothetical protein
MRAQNRLSNSLISVLAIVLVTVWAVGYFGYNASNLIHVLLVIAGITVFFKIIRDI